MRHDVGVRGDLTRLALEAKAPKQAPEPIAHLPVKIDVELSLATRRLRLELLTLGAQHRGPAYELLLAFRKAIEATEVRGNIFVQIAESSRGDRAAIREREKLASVRDAALTLRLARGYLWAFQG